MLTLDWQKSNKQIRDNIISRQEVAWEFTYGSVLGKRDLLAIFHVIKTNLIAEKLPFQILQTILKYS